MLVKLSLALVLLSLFSQAVHAAIIEVTDALSVIAPPADIRSGALISDSAIHIFPERQNFVLTQELTFNISTPGTSPGATDNNTSQTTIPAGTRVDSYFFHAQSVSGTQNSPVIYHGSITFDTEVLAIAVFNLRLNQSDAVVGLNEVLYPTGTERQLDINPGGIVGERGNDHITLSPDRRTVLFEIGNTGGLDQARILVASVPVPEPSTLALLGAAALTLLVRRRLVRRLA